MHLSAQVAADPVKHRMFPWVGFGAAVPASVLAVAMELFHDLISTDAKAVLCAAADVGKEVGKVWSKSVTFNQALPHALADPGLNLGIRQFSNRVDPE